MLSLLSCEKAAKVCNIVEINASRECGWGKASLDGLTPVWNPGDEICVASGGVSSKFVTDGSGVSASFVGHTDLGAGGFYAVYPFDASEGSEGNLLKISVPKTQNGIPGTFDPKAFVCAGRVLNSKDGASVLMKNVCSLVEVSISSGGISSLVFSSGGAEAVSGTVGVTDSGVVEKEFLGNSSVRLEPAAGDVFAPGTYYISILPVFLSRGFVLTFEKEGYIASLVLDSSLRIPRSCILPLDDEGLRWRKVADGEAVLELGDPSVSDLTETGFSSQLTTDSAALPKDIQCGMEYRKSEDSDYVSVPGVCSKEYIVNASLGKTLPTGSYVVRAWVKNPDTGEKLVSREVSFRVFTETSNFGLSSYWIRSGTTSKLPSSTANWLSDVVKGSGVYLYDYYCKDWGVFGLCADDYFASHSSMGLRFGSKGTSGGYYRYYLRFPHIEGMRMGGIAIYNNDVSSALALASEVGADSKSGLPDGNVVESHLVSKIGDFPKGQWGQIFTDSESEPKFLVGKSQKAYILKTVILYYEL